MENPSTYDVAIIGGGLAGLSLAITLAQKGRSVVLFEKEEYPFHRVCGEYVSMESWPFLQKLGLPLERMNLPRIRRLAVTAPDGFMLTHALDMGGFGISRYTLDALLAARARACGVTLRTGCKVSASLFGDDYFEIRAGAESITAKAAVGCFGKRSNLDVQMNRAFIREKAGKLNNYIGIKYHVRADLPADLISLHNFPDGYCGISAVDGDRYCLCYLTTASNLEKSGNNIRQMEEQVLFMNPHLKDIFTHARFEWDKPESIAQISFSRKAAVEGHLLMAGDAAGMISPLCGNGMSMAFRSGQLALEVLLPFLEGEMTRPEMETAYRNAWTRHFSLRMGVGRMIQSIFGKPRATKLFLKFLKPFPILTTQIIRSTHGNAF